MQTCAFTTSHGLSINKNNIMSLSILNEDLISQQFYLDTPSILSMALFSKNATQNFLLPKFINDIPKTLITPSSLLALAYPLISATSLPLHPLGMTYSSLSTHQRFSEYSRRQFPLLAYSMAMTTAFPSYSCPAAISKATFKTSTYFRYTFLELSADRESDITFCYATAHPSHARLHLLAQHNQITKANPTSALKKNFFSLPTEIQLQIISLCLSLPFAPCDCHSNKKPYTNSHGAPRSSRFILTPIAEIDSHTKDDAYSPTYIFHVSGPPNLLQVPSSPTYLEVDNQLATASMRCKCHFSHLSGMYNEDPYYGFPTYIRRFLSTHDALDGSPPLNRKLCHCV
jgi:hypothetical protein